MTRASNPPYPVSAPFQPQAQLVAQAARLRFWTVALFAVTAVLLLTMVTLAVFGVKWLGGADAAPGVEQADKDAPPRPAPAEKASQARAQADRLRDAALGALSGAHLWQSRLNIGVVADGVENKTYTMEQGEKMLQRVVGFMDQVDYQLRKLKGADLEPDEQKSVDRIRKVAAALRGEVRALRDYWKSGDLEDAEAYRQARDAAMLAVDDFLTEAGSAPKAPD
jgi:hypothetical protein